MSLRVRTYRSIASRMRCNSVVHLPRCRSSLCRYRHQLWVSEHTTTTHRSHLAGKVRRLLSLSQEVM